MKKKMIAPLLPGILILLAACGGGKQTPESIAKEWCELNAKIHQAPDGGPEYEKAKDARKAFEKKIESKYGKDESFMKKVEQEVEKCEDASEGR